MISTSKKPVFTSRFAQRWGGVAVLVAVMIVIFVVGAALAIDLSYARVVRAQLRNAADSAALAAAGTLRDSHTESTARAAAVSYGLLNQAGGKYVQIDGSTDVVFGRRVFSTPTQTWSFVAGQTPYDSVKVTARRTTGSLGGPVDLFFGKTISSNPLGMSASAVATYLPRDIALVIDLSGSMLYDSGLTHETSTTINNQAIWQALGSHTYGNMNNWNTTTTISSSSSTSTILSALGLTNVAYPYPQGSWSEFVTYVKSDSRLPTTYRNKYGLKTFIDYLLMARSYKSSTPLLSTTPEQPVTALKGALNIMLDYLASLDTDEHVSMSTFDDTARIELDLTNSFTTLKNNVTDKQAGHYARNTNIGEGLKKGIATLTGASARPNAKKVIILFSDGVANFPGSYAAARQYAVDQATAAANQDIVIHTIAFSSLADQALMQQIAQIGHGVYFYVEQTTVTQYTQDFQDVILNVSSIRPLALTQ